MSLRLAPRQVVRTRQLQGRLDGLAAAGHGVDPRIVHRQQRRELRRDFANAWDVQTEHYTIKTNHDDFRL